MLTISASREGNLSVHGREDRVIFADADTDAGIELRPALANENVPSQDLLAAEALDAEALSVGISPVAGGSAALLGRKKL